jgi:release factor glutamine methyltransferase
VTTIRDILDDAKERIALVSTSAGLDAQLLLAAVLDVSRAHVIAHPEKPLTGEQARRYEALIRRRELGEPVAYLLGRRAFYDRDFRVTPAVLIPRPETEHLLEIALDFARARPSLTAVDVGTGSGALAITFAANVPTASVYATDLSTAALAVARSNAAEHNVDVTFYQGDLLLPLLERGIKVDLLMANLPYVPADELPFLPVSTFEPRLALDGGPDGMSVVRRFLAQVDAVCNPGAELLLEIGAGQGALALDIVRAAFGERLALLQLHHDYAGHDRVMQARFAG